jgi:hypothetical protein
MTGLAIRIPSQYPAQCPICRRHLDSVAVEFCDGLAFCSECRNHADVRALSVEVDAYRCVGPDAGFRERSGLVVWSPHSDADHGCTASQYLLRSGRLSAPLADSIQRWAGKITDRWGTLGDLDEPQFREIPASRLTPSSLCEAQMNLFLEEPDDALLDVHS